MGNCYSSFFKHEVGVRQGDNLSTLLNTIFVNDFKAYLKNPEKWLSCVQSILIKCRIPGAYHFIENGNEAHLKEYTKKKLDHINEK